MTKVAARSSSKHPKPTTKPAAKPRTPVKATPKPAAKALRRAESDRPRVAAKPQTKAPITETEAPRNRDAGMAAVEHSFDLLDVLARISPVATATLERETRCPRSTMLRLLAALQTRGFVIHNEFDDTWQLGPHWDVLQRAAHSQGALAAASMPFLAALAKATGENVYLRARDGLEAETIAVYQADPVLRVYTEVGKRGPLHAGPARLLLAHAPEPVQTQVLSQRLPRFTPATRTDPELDRGRSAAPARPRLSDHRRRGERRSGFGVGPGARCERASDRGTDPVGAVDAPAPAPPAPVAAAGAGRRSPTQPRTGRPGRPDDHGGTRGEWRSAAGRAHRVVAANLAAQPHSLGTVGAQTSIIVMRGLSPAHLHGDRWPRRTLP